MDNTQAIVEDRIFAALVLNDYEGAHYATLVKEGLKTLETRMRMFSFVGDLVICAGKKSVTKNAGKAICMVHFGKGRPMVGEDEQDACIEYAEGLIVYPLTNLRHFSYDFEFTDYAVKKNYQGIFSVRIPDFVKVFSKEQKDAVCDATATDSSTTDHQQNTSEK